LGSNAAKQMLLLHHLAGDNASGPAPLYRTTFVNNLTSNGLPGSFGWPQECRKVSLVNGSLNCALFGAPCLDGTKIEVFMEYKAFRLYN